MSPDTKLNNSPRPCIDFDHFDEGINITMIWVGKSFPNFASAIIVMNINQFYICHFYLFVYFLIF